MAIKFNIGVKLDGSIFKGTVLQKYYRMLGASYKEAGLYLEGEVAKRTPVNTGRLRKSVSSRVRSSGKYQYGQVFSPLWYANAVERGQRPHLPPERPLVLWVKRKLSNVKARLKKMLAPGTAIKMPSQQVVRRVAWAVRKKIARAGTKGVHMFKNTFKSLLVRKTVKGIFQKNQAEFVNRLNKGGK